jgi:hypothetical protein
MSGYEPQSSHLLFEKRPSQPSLAKGCLGLTRPAWCLLCAVFASVPSTQASHAWQEAHLALANGWGHFRAGRAGHACCMLSNSTHLSGNWVLKCMAESQLRCAIADHNIATDSDKADSLIFVIWPGSQTSTSTREHHRIREPTPQDRSLDDPSVLSFRIGRSRPAETLALHLLFYFISSLHKGWDLPSWHFDLSLGRISDDASSGTGWNIYEARLSRLDKEQDVHVQLGCSNREPLRAPP